MSEKTLTIAEAVQALEKGNLPAPAPVPVPEDPKPVPEAVESPQKTRCSRCGWEMRKLVSKVAEEDVREYVRCILAGRPFAKTYTLFEGAVCTQFSLLTSNESDVLGVMLSKISREDKMMLTQQALRLKLLFYLRRFNDKSYTVPKADVDVETEYNSRFGGIGEDIPVLLIRNMMEFTRLSEMLTETGFDANFWKGAGLG